MLNFWKFLAKIIGWSVEIAFNKFREQKKKGNEKMKQTIKSQLLSHFEKTFFFRAQAENFLQGCQTCILRVQSNNYRTNSVPRKIVN